MHGRIESLNAAVAGSILLYEAAAQRRPGEAAGPPLEPAPGEASGATDVASGATDEASEGGASTPVIENGPAPGVLPAADPDATGIELPSADDNTDGDALLPGGAEPA